MGIKHHALGSADSAYEQLPVETGQALAGSRLPYAGIGHD